MNLDHPALAGRGHPLLKLINANAAWAGPISCMHERLPPSRKPPAHPYVLIARSFSFFPPALRPVALSEFAVFFLVGRKCRERRWLACVLLLGTDSFLHSLVLCGDTHDCLVTRGILELENDTVKRRALHPLMLRYDVLPFFAHIVWKDIGLKQTGYRHCVGQDFLSAAQHSERGYKLKVTKLYTASLSRSPASIVNNEWAWILA